MYRWFLCLFLVDLFLSLNGLCIATEEKIMLHENWNINAQKVNEEAIQWLKDHLKLRLASEKLLQNPLEEENKNSTKACSTCRSVKDLSDDLPALYVFMSFSLEDNLWVQFSKELEKIGGIFVLRGLPQNSFKELANRIFELQQKGVNAPIQIHPNLFPEYDVQLVPTIAVVEGRQYDKISGNLSIKCALERMSIVGETKQAKILYQKYLEKS